MGNLNLQPGVPNIIFFPWARPCPHTPKPPDNDHSFFVVFLSMNRFLLPGALSVNSIHLEPIHPYHHYHHHHLFWAWRNIFCRCGLEQLLWRLLSPVLNRRFSFVLKSHCGEDRRYTNFNPLHPLHLLIVEILHTLLVERCFEIV